jgi:hypothetical protein
MPVYVYQEILEDGSEGEMIEIEQPMSAALLTRHPITGRPVRRVYQPPSVTTKYTPGRSQKMLSEKNVARAGFTKYVRDKQTGTYHKTAGHDPRAPDVLNRKKS